MFVSEQRLVAFTPYGRRAGSSRARVFEWLEHLGLDAVIHCFTQGNRAGVHELLQRPIAAVRRHRALTAMDVDRGDVVLIHRELSPLSDGRAEEALLRSGSRGVVDLDDGLQWDWGQGGWARRLQPKAPKIIRMVRSADVVIAGNDAIAEWAAPHAERVVVIPTCVNLAKYRRKSNYDLHDPPLIGWIGSAATETHLASMGSELMRAHRSTGARVALLGGGVPRLGTLESIIDRTPWSESEAYCTTATWDVGVMPLPNRLMERAKCAYKLLQYGAACLPAMTSCVGVNAELARSPGAHRRADSTTGRGSLQDVLAASPSERAENAGELHRTVGANFSFEAWQAEWEAAVFGSRPVTDRIDVPSGRN